MAWGASAVVLTAFAFCVAPGAPSTAFAAAAAACAGTDSDFNGDGVRDTAIADPEASVGDKKRAGLVRIVYGDGKGTAEVSQESPGVPGAAEDDDQFGFALAIYDANNDGCADLAVGVPYEDVETAADAGLVDIVYGAPGGINTGPVPTEHVQGATGTLGGSAEAGDWAGYALAGGKTSAGVPYLLIGTPGESIGTVEDAGSFHYVHGTAQTVTGVHQDTTTGGDVPGVVETDDRYGASLAATPTHFAVGSPGEALGDRTFAGGVGVFSHTLVSGSPKPQAGLGQDQEAVTGGEEVGDGFGTSLAMVPYRPAGATTTTESLLAVGVPGEDLSTTVDAGAVQVFRVPASGTVTETAWIDQNTEGVDEQAEAGDFFGQRLAAVNTSPNTVASATTTRLAVGVPGEETSEEHPEKGGVHLFPLVGAAGASDAWIEPGSGIPGTPAPRQLTGMSLAATPVSLYVGAPYGPAEGHAVHAFPWNVASGGAPTTTLRPGEGGIPAGDIAFGAVVR